ncbi:hypothetical protein MTP02_35660 [Streptomyces albus]|uniref:Uncharacterized protein n=1 Tax=Streptomyces albidoflavus TaxID=1886 RepID=A0AA37BZC8_9ACTN|nr:hypothetical protein MTP02_35660 [Streptomyces albus]GHI47625.1 hypothetical protein ScoT_37990 [Streptomyces albidoflavus]
MTSVRAEDAAPSARVAEIVAELMVVASLSSVGCARLVVPGASPEAPRSGSVTAILGELGERRTGLHVTKRP